MAQNLVELVRICQDDRKGIERFIRVPWYIYREHRPDPHWVPPLLIQVRNDLDPRKNPFFLHADMSFWIVCKNGHDVGRVAAIHDQDWCRLHDPYAGLFGFFECPDEFAIAKVLLDACAEWLRNRRLRTVIGPTYLSTNYATGMLVQGFDSDPFVQMPFNPDYYNTLLLSYGFEKEKDLWEWSVDVTKPVPERVACLVSRLGQRRKVSVRKLDLNDWNAEIERLRDVYNHAWSDLWGFLPLRDDEMHYIATNMRTVIAPEVALVAEAGGQPIAMAICILNINPILKKINGRLFPFGLARLIWYLKVRSIVKTGRLILLGIKRDFRTQGVDSRLFMEMHRGTSRLGWDSIEICYTLEDNHLINRVIEAMNGKRVKTYRIYRKDLL